MINMPFLVKNGILRINGELSLFEEAWLHAYDIMDITFDLQALGYYGHYRPFKAK